MDNWKNVNNWHWTEKNCIKWATTYFKTSLTNLQVEDNEIKVEIVPEVKVDGDCDLNHRKGKLLPLFDMKLELPISSKDSTGKEVIKGTLIVREVCHDSDLSDYVFEWNVITSYNDKYRSKVIQLIKKELETKIKKIITSFQKDLIEQHSKDVYIEGETKKKSSLKTPTKKDEAKKNDIKKSAKISNNVTIKLDHLFYAAPHDVYKVFTDAKLISLWSNSNTTFVAAPNLPFKLFNHQIKGTVLKVIKDSYVSLLWKDEDWDKDHNSTVSLFFEPEGEATKLTIVHESIPESQLQSTEMKWKNKILQPIEKCFGFNQQLANSWLKSPSVLITSTVAFAAVYLGFQYFSR
ncbi:hypothetical protein K502DRAFT_312814 [Neoconidiobolus thromboides FSU 785]|nr:hypothetical protein K502DRAFT_312814 [Neoconidiobolus thromboides FSU 785]